MMPDAKNKKLVAEQSFAGYEFSAYMGGKGMDKSLVNKARRILASVLIAALCVCNMAVPAFAEEAVAASFRLYQTEGTVTVQNQNGKEMTAMQDMKLFNGYQVSTEQKSYAWFEADSTKLFKMDAVSNLEVRKKGKQSELLLNSGNLFFNVTEHLQDDEVLNIRTSSMVVGIRGTSGWVKVIDQYHTILYMLEGSVEASVTDPVSGQRKSITLRGGQRAEFWIYDKNKEGDKCDIIVRQYGEEEIDGFVAVELKKNQQLQDRIRGGGGSGAGGSAGGGTGAGFDLVSTIAKAEERLKQDQEEVARKLEEIKKQLAGLAHKVDVDPVFSNNTSKDDSGSDGGVSGGSATETVADPTTLTMPVSDDTVHDYLNNKKVSVILQPSSNASDNVLTVDSGLTVPSGKSLTVGNGISADVQNGQTLQVNGHMEMEGSLTNAGTVNNTSANTLQIGGDLDNAGTLENRTGRLIVNGAFLNRGTLSTGNTVENSSAVQNTGTFTVTGGTAGAVDLNRGGTLNVNSGTISDVVENGGTLQLNGGTISSLTVKQGDIVLCGGYQENLVVTQGTVDAQGGAEIGRVEIQGGTFELNGGTILNGIKQNTAHGDSQNINVRLNSGKINAGDSTAIEINNGGWVQLTYYSKKDGVESGVEVSADKVKQLVKITGDGKIGDGKQKPEMLPEWYGRDSVTMCHAANKMLSSGEISGPYQLDGFCPSVLYALMHMGGQEEIFVMNRPEEITTQNEYSNIETIGLYYGRKMCIDLNGHTLSMNGVGLNVAVQGMGEKPETLDTWLTIRDETGDGTFGLNAPIVIEESGMVRLENMKVERGIDGYFKNYGPAIDRVTIEGPTYSYSGPPPKTVPFITGSINQNINKLVYEKIPTKFFKSDGAKSVFSLKNSRLTSNGLVIFDLSSMTEENTRISYEGNVLLSNDNDNGDVFSFARVGTDSHHAVYGILPAPDKCSIDDNNGIVIRSKSSNFCNIFDLELQDIGYGYYRKDESPYGYLTAYEPQIMLLNMELATPSDMIPIEDMPLATDSDADSIANEIIDEDEDYEKSTPSNADDFIHDEDEPYQDSDDDDDEEPRNIPVKSVTPAIPSTSTKDTTQPEEDPDPKKDENPDANNPEQEENQNGDPDSGPEEEQEPEKEQADLLHTEPSNVPDQREEEES